MKTLKFFVCALFCGVLLLTSCSEDPFSEGFGQHQPGVEGLNTHDDDDDGTAPPPPPPGS